MEEEEGGVDWDVVDDELYQIPSVYKDQRFDSLKHVLTVLGAVDSEAALEELRQQHETVDGLVDDVVSTYHNGFNKAIHNYSQILQLFTEAKGQVITVKQNLEDAKRRLGATSRSLQQQWKRNMTLTHICELLRDAQAIVDMPSRIQKMEETGDWSAAVELLLDGCYRLAREEMSQVGALRDIKKDMGTRRNSLHKAIVAEFERRIYFSAIGASSDSSEAEDETPELEQALVMEEIPALAGIAEPSPVRKRQSMILDARRSMVIASRRSAMIDSRKSLSLGRQVRQSRHSTVLDLRRAASAGASRQSRLSQQSKGPVLRGSLVLSRPPSAGGGGSASGSNLARHSAVQHGRRQSRSSLVIGRRTSATAQPQQALVGEDNANASKEHSAAASLSLPALVDAVVQIGGVTETLTALRRHMAAQMHNVIMRAVESADPVPAAGDSSSAATMEAVTTAAQSVLSRIFEDCQQVLLNVVAIVRLMAAAKPALPSAGLDLLLLQRQEQGIRFPEAHLTPDGARREAEFAWECMQKELQRLLAELLDGSSLSSSAGASASSSIGWQAGQNGVMAPRDAGRLTFSFEAEAAGSHPGAAPRILQRDQTVRFADSQDLTTLLLKALGGQSGSMHLTPILFSPVVSFTDHANWMLQQMLEDDPDDDSDAEGARDAPPQRRQLRSFVDSFVIEAFLPEVYVDFRGRCTKMLEDAEAFHARARQRGPASADADEGGRLLLPAALSTDRMLSSLLLWAANMPPFASHLVGVVESVLSRVLDAFQHRMANALAGFAVSGLAHNPTLARMMAQEPSATLAGDAVAFFSGRPADSIDAFVTEVVNAGFAGGGEMAEAEVLSRLLQERGVSPQQLLSMSGDGQRLASLAALSDSLDFVADAIVRFGERRLADSGMQSYMSGAKGQGAGLTEGLAHLLDRFRAASGTAARALRLELTLLLVYYLQNLAKASYVCGEEEAKEVDECIGAFSRAVARGEEELSPYLPPAKRSYVFGSLAAQAARFIMWLLPELKEINAAGVARMNRQLSVLQPALAAAGAAGGQFRPEAVRVFERARTYYTLLTYSADSLVKVAADRPGRFTPSEYLALLQVSVPDRYVSSQHRSQLQRIVAPGVPRQSAFKAMRIS